LYESTENQLLFKITYVSKGLFFNKAKDLPFSLTKIKRIWTVHCGHDHIWHTHRPTWPNTNNWPRTPTEDSSDFADELWKRNMLGLLPTESSTIH
jgi:hypothetical protein